MAVLFDEAAPCGHCDAPRTTDRTLYTDDGEPSCWTCYLSQWDLPRLWDKDNLIRMPERFKVEVTYADMDNRNRDDDTEESGMFSPIARAANRFLQEQVSPGLTAETYRGWLLVSDSDHHDQTQTYDLPERAQRWLTYWYDHRRCHAFSFVATHGRDFLEQERDIGKPKPPAVVEPPKAKPLRLPLRVIR